MWKTNLIFLNCRDNRTPVAEGINVVGALRNGGLRPEFEDDVVSGLEVDSLNEVKFFTRVEIRDRIIHSRAYKRVSVRNSYTVSYKDNNKIKYGQLSWSFCASIQSSEWFSPVCSSDSSISETDWFCLPNKWSFGCMSSYTHCLLVSTFKWPLCFSPHW